MLFQKKSSAYTPTSSNSNQKLIAICALVFFFALISIIYLLTSGPSTKTNQNANVLSFNNFSITVPPNFESTSGGPTEQIITPVDGSDRLDKGDSIKVQKYLKNSGTDSLSKLRKRLTTSADGKAVDNIKVEDFSVSNSKVLMVESTSEDSNKIQYYLFKPKNIWLVEFDSNEAEAPILLDSKDTLKTFTEN